MESGVYFGVESGVTFGVGFFLILFKNAFCFIYKNSDYNLLPVEGIIWWIDYIHDCTLTVMTEVNKQKFWRDKQ